MVHVTMLPKDRTSHMVLEVIKSHVKNHGVGYKSKPLSRLDSGCTQKSSQSDPQTGCLTVGGLREPVSSQA